jgi:hypothetical protein
MGYVTKSFDNKTLNWFYGEDCDPNFGPPLKEHTTLFINLMEDPDFKREFIDRAAIYMGDFLNERRIREIWDEMLDRVKSELPYHYNSDIIHDYDHFGYDGQLDFCRRWIAERPPFFYRHIAEFYELGAPVAMTVANRLPHAKATDLGITFNGITLTRGSFDGCFFANRAVTITADPAVKEWEIITYNHDGSIHRNITDDCTFTMPDAAFVTVNPIVDGMFDIGDVNTDGVINTSDVTALIAKILANTDFRPDYDVNADGTVNVSDVTELINIILNQ